MEVALREAALEAKVRGDCQTLEDEAGQANRMLEVPAAYGTRLIVERASWQAAGVEVD